MSICFIGVSVFSSPFRVSRRMTTARCASSAPSNTLKDVPVLVTDLLDTVVADPFSRGMASHFGFPTFDSFLQAKTPGVWLQFERGEIGESDLAASFFRDGRRVDVEKFKHFLRENYELLPGVEDMLKRIGAAGVSMHICSNYPIWANMIEEKLQLEQRFGLQWTFLSAREGIRKPSREAYLRTAQNAGVRVDQCVLLDDRLANCEGAIQAGYRGAILFQNARQALEDLSETFRTAGIYLETSN